MFPPQEVSARAFEALNDHDLVALRSLLAEDVVDHVVPLGVYDGRDAVLAYHEELLAAAPDLRVDVTHIAAAGEEVLVAWELTATFTGSPFQGLLPTGSRIRLEGATSHVVREGRIASAHVVYDGAACERQLGLLPIRDSAADRALIVARNIKTRLRARTARTASPTAATRPQASASEPRAAVRPGELEDLLQRDELAVIATDLAGVVTHWSAGAERLYGWSREEVLGRPITALTVGPGDEAVARQIMEQVRRTGRWEGEFWVRRQDGTSFLAYVREAIVCDEDGQPTGLVGVSIETFLD